jgi:glutamate/tyrosine decarboxylase-like PLP-dependent enzyme
MFDGQIGVRERPVWQPVPEQSAAVLRGPVPRQPTNFGDVVQDMLTHVAPYPAGHGHPRFWGWVCGTGTPIGMVADMIAAGVNATSGVFNDAPTRVEAQVVGWMRDLMGFPASTTGLLTSGASMANVIGLTVARDSRIDSDVVARGLGAVAGTPAVYASAEVHSSVDKAVQLLGLGRDNLRKVPVDSDYRLRIDALEEMLERDRAAGYVPFAVVANAGTVNTGAIDDLDGIADVAEREGLWLHVDGAIGAVAMISTHLRPRLRGIERADSIAFDFHKWLYVPYEAGCVIVRDGAAHRQSFAASASYLDTPSRGIAAWDQSTNVLGPQLSRGFKALKVWAQIREHGLDKLGRMLEQNVEHIAHLAHLVDEHPELECLAPATLNIACFRYRGAGATDEALDALNLELLMRLQESGVAAPSSTRIQGRFALRVANANQRSRREDFELLVREVVRLGRELGGVK